MARLAAVAKALYYATPPRVVDLILQTIQYQGGGSLLDLCAGEGHAASTIAKAWGLKSYGVEIHYSRALMCAFMLDMIRHGSHHQLVVSPERPFSVVFLNPPYDDGADASGRSLRQEVLFLEEALKYLAHGGLLIFIPPEHILKNEACRTLLREKCRNIQAWRFPDPEYHDFNQVVVVAQSRNPSLYYHYGSLADLDRELPVLGTGTYEVRAPEPQKVTSFKLSGISPEAICPSFEEHTGGYGSPKWKMLTEGPALGRDAPLTAPRPGHQAMLLAAGRLNGVEINGSLVKGGSDKVETKIEHDKETVYRESIASHMSVLDLKTGALDTWRVDQDIEKTVKWFGDHGPQIAEAIRNSHTPLFDGDLTHYDFSHIQAPGILPGKTKAELLPLQKETSAAIAFRWRDHKSALLSGELGAGKTTMAIAACELAGHRKVVVVCPTHLVKKWIRECEAITGTPGVAMTAKTLSDVDKFFEKDHEDDGFLGLFGLRCPNPARYLILSKETAKLGSRWAPAFVVRKRIVTEEETVNERSMYSYYTTKRVVTVRRKKEQACCPSCGTSVGILGHVDMKTKLQCQTCKEPLWQVVPLNAKGTKRWPLASHINHRYARRYALVLDESHQYSKSESDQSKAVQVLISGATKVLAMTGTLYGGRASSLFPLLYKLEPSFRDLYQYNECSKFVEHHGLFETVYTEEERTSVYGYRRGGQKSGGRVREIPGMSPAMIPLLLPYTVFVKLKDMNLDLPPYSEHVELIPHDPAIEAAVRNLASEVKTVLRQYPDVLGQYLMACLGYPDFPEQEERIVAPPNDRHGLVELASAPAFPSTVLPKDQKVVDLAMAEQKQGRRTLVFMTQTHRRDARKRVKAALESAGLRVVVLDSNVPPERREEWLRKEDAAGFDVMITNGRLVETGLDLLFAHTIIQYGVEYSVPSLRQSIRRSWRLGQTKPVKVYFLGYQRTMQETAIDLIAKKMRASEMVDGDEVGGLAQHDIAGTNFLVELAHAAMS